MHEERKDYFGNLIKKDDTVIFIGPSHNSRYKFRIGTVTNTFMGLYYCIQVKSNDIYYSVMNKDVIVSNNDPRLTFKIIKEEHDD